MLTGIYYYSEYVHGIRPTWVKSLGHDISFAEKSWTWNIYVWDDQFSLVLAILFFRHVKISIQIITSYRAGSCSTSKVNWDIFG